MAAQVAAGAVIAAAAVTARTIRHYQVHKRLLLDSQQPLRYPSSDVHIITALAPRDEEDMEALVEGLEEGIAAAGGRRVYVGRVLAPGGRSSQMPEAVQASVRVVLVTQWPSAEAFIAFRAAALPPAGEGEFWLAEGCGWRGAWSTLWRRSPMMGVVTPLMMGWSRARSLLCAPSPNRPPLFLRRDFLAVDRRGERHHVQTGALTPEEFQAIQDSGEGAGPEKGQHGFSAYEQVARGSAALRGGEDEEDQPVMIWNWLLPGDEAQRASDGEYSKRMMEMLAQNGAGLMDAGTPCAISLKRLPLSLHKPSGLSHIGAHQGGCTCAQARSVSRWRANPPGTSPWSLVCTIPAEDSSPT